MPKPRPQPRLRITNKGKGGKKTPFRKNKAARLVGGNIPNSELKQALKQERRRNQVAPMQIDTENTNPRKSIQERAVSRGTRTSGGFSIGGGIVTSDGTILNGDRV